jgi:hypothetical protein
MKWLVWVLAIFLLLTIESGIFGQFNFLPVVPYLGVIFCAAALVLAEKVELITITAVTGLFLDLISTLSDGTMLLSLSFAVFCTYIVIYWWLTRDYHIWTLFFSVAVCTLIFFVTVLGVSKLFELFGGGQAVDYSHLIQRKALWYIVINLLLTYPVYLYYAGVKILANKVARKIK